MLKTPDYPQSFVEQSIAVANSSFEDKMKFSNYSETGELPKIEVLPVSIKGITCFKTKEFSTFCKRMQMPDYVDELAIIIAPDEATFEMKSMRDYLIAYRELDIYQEETAATILMDIVKFIKPLYCTVSMKFKARGGMATHTMHTYAAPDFDKSSVDLRLYLTPDQIF